MRVRAGGLIGALWAVACFGAACGTSRVQDTPPDAALPPEGPEPDASFLEPPDAGAELDAGPPDAGADAGAPPDAGFVFGTPGPWPVANVIYGSDEGIRERPIVGLTTDEAQNRWVATEEALYLLRPGRATFERFTAEDGLHLQTNPVAYCDANFAGGDRACPIYGAAADPGISTIVGGGPDEVFVGYHGDTGGPGDWSDPNRHRGKLDRVRLRADGTLQVDRFDLVANAHGAQYWHNRTVHRMAFDHFVHAHDLYVGLNHGVTILKPDRYRPPNPGEWFDSVNLEYMGDHLHPRVCFHAECDPNSSSNQRMGGWRGLAIAPDGDLWVAGKWTAGKIRWATSPRDWFSRPGNEAFAASFGDPYPAPANEEGYVNEPVFRVPLEGDPVYLTAVSVAPDGRVWFASEEYGLAAWSGRRFIVHDPVLELGLDEVAIRDLVALPDGRLALATREGVLLWHPWTGARQPLRAPDWLADDGARRLELDTMTSPPALHVVTDTGAAVLRLLP